MADINIERKKSSVLPWIIGLLLLAAIVWAVLQYMGDGDTADTAAEQDPAVVEQPVQYAPAPAPLANDSAVPPAVGVSDTSGGSAPAASTTGM